MSSFAISIFPAIIFSISPRLGRAAQVTICVAMVRVIAIATKTARKVRHHRHHCCHNHDNNYHRRHYHHGKGDCGKNAYCKAIGHTASFPQRNTNKT